MTGKTAAQGGVRFYQMDNEIGKSLHFKASLKTSSFFFCLKGIWHITHFDLHPNPVTYDEIWNRTVWYASAVKIADSSAQVFGPSQEYKNYHSVFEVSSNKPKKNCVQ